MNKLTDCWRQWRSNSREKTKQEVITEIMNGFQICEKGGKLWIVNEGVGIIELTDELTTIDILSKLEIARHTALNYYNSPNIKNN